MLEEVIVIGLAGFRLANFLVNENGPFEIFERLRQAAGLKPGLVTGSLPLLFTCMFCMTVWTTIVMFIIYFLSPIIVMLIAAMSIALMVDNRVSGDH